MPFISIKCYPKDEETKKLAVERINQVMLDVWGCPPHALTISLEEVAPENWVEHVVKTEIEPRMDKMMILSGEKKYE